MQYTNRGVSGGTGLTGRLSKHPPAWERIRELHSMRFAG